MENIGTERMRGRKGEKTDGERQSERREEEDVQERKKEKWRKLKRE